MTGPAVNLRAWQHATQVVNGPQGGVDNLLQLVPTVEGLLAGGPPVLPVLVQRVEHDDHVRRLLGASGMAVTRPLSSAARVRYSVTWPPMTLQERDAMLLWLNNEVQFTRHPWPLEVEGVEDEASVSTAVRFLEQKAMTQFATIADGVTLMVEQSFI